MKLQFENVNTNKLHDELITAGITPQLVESLNNTTWVTVEDNQVDVVNAVAAVHNPAPMPLPKTEIENINDALLITINDGIKTQGLDELKDSVCSYLNAKGYYFYGLINESNVCIKIIVSKTEIVENNKILLPEYNNDYLGRKWVDNEWSTQKYDYPIETPIQDQINAINDAIAFILGF